MKIGAGENYEVVNLITKKIMKRLEQINREILQNI